MWALAEWLQNTTNNPFSCSYFAAMELLVLKGRTYTPDVLEQCRAAGWRLRWVDPIEPPHPSDFARFRDQFVKLHLWSMEEFAEVVYMDLDAAFVGPLQGTFTSLEAYPTDCKVWAARDIRASVWQDAFNMGVAGIRPNKTEFDWLYQLMAQDKVQYEHTMSEQGFLNAIYTSKNGAWCELDFEKNANLAAYSQQRAFWDKAAKQIQVVHYTMTKPWECGAEYRPVCNLWETEAAAFTAPVTVVTAYYPGPSKHQQSEYAAWGRTFLQQPVPMVIFTDSRNNLPQVDTRDPNTTVIVELDEALFRTSQTHFSWDKQLQMDPERGIHHTRLFKLWAEKTQFVMRAIHMSTFNSSHYVWVDFGCFRSPAWAGGKWVVHAERLPTLNRMLMLNLPVSHPTKKVAGTIFGGSITAWRSWSKRFFDLLSREGRKGTVFVGDDQIAMSLVAERFPHLVCRVAAVDTNDDVWWFLQYYLAGKTPINPHCNLHVPRHGLQHGRRSDP